MLNNPIAGILPWIIFWVVAAAFRQWETAILIALAVAVVVTVVDAVPSLSRACGAKAPGPVHRLRWPKILNLATVIFFVVFALLEPLLSLPDLIQTEIHSQTIANGALALVIVGSILAGHPFSEQYAREVTPPEAWHTQGFRRINLTISWVWGVSMGTSAALGVPATQVDPASGVYNWLVWYLPGMLMAGSFLFTRWYPGYARGRLAATRAAPSPEAPAVDRAAG